MSIFKRLSATVHATVDRTVASIENHDAIIQATLADSRKAVATAKIRLARVETDGKSQAEQIETLKKRIEIWTVRAKDTGATDREKALACLQQRANDQAALEQAEATLNRHREMKERMRDKLKSLEQRVSPGMNIDETFDRWEISIRERELRNEYSLDLDETPSSLDDEFKASESDTALNMELDALLDNSE